MIVLCQCHQFKSWFMLWKLITEPRSNRRPKQRLSSMQLLCRRQIQYTDSFTLSSQICCDQPWNEFIFLKCSFLSHYLIPQLKSRSRSIKWVVFKPGSIVKTECRQSYLGILMELKIKSSKKIAAYIPSDFTLALSHSIFM